MLYVSQNELRVLKLFSDFCISASVSLFTLSTYLLLTLNKTLRDIGVSPECYIVSFAILNHGIREQHLS